MEDQRLTACGADGKDDALVPDEGLFRTDEVVIEEMAIDGICGVY